VDRLPEPQRARERDLRHGRRRPPARRRRRRDHDGRGRGHPDVFEVVNGGGTAPTEEIVAQGLEAAKPAIAAICNAQKELAAKAPKEPLEFPVFLDYDDDVLQAVTQAGEADLTAAMQIAGKQERDAASDAAKAKVLEAVGRSSRVARRRSAPRSAA
jgi:polyribonucleotide nucleotidyltransferase